MITRQKIDEAIAAHGFWKERLHAALDSKGTPGDALREAGRDDRCDLGKWLKAVQVQSGGQRLCLVEDIARLHSQFHDVAGRVVELLAAGHSGEAKRLLCGAGEFETVSAALVQAMIEWRDANLHR
jgi:hypothetical protein